MRRKLGTRAADLGELADGVFIARSAATAPALNRFDEEYRGRGLVVIGLYHHKDPEPLDVETVRGYIEHYQFRFPVAMDPDWQTLKR